MQTSADLTISRIIDLVNGFNFDRVHKIMIATDWKWARPDGLRTPTIDEMRDHCVNLLINADREKTTISSGGFEAIYKMELTEDPENPRIAMGRKVFKLQFIVAWDHIRV